MLEDVAASRTFPTVPPDCHMLSVNLRSSLKSTGSTSGSQTTLMESVSDCLSRHMNTCGLLEVILQGSGSAPSVCPRTNAKVELLPLGYCPPTTSSTYPDVLACLLVAPPCSGHFTDSTACIDVPSWMSCTTWATCVGRRLCLTLPLA